MAPTTESTPAPEEPVVEETLVEEVDRRHVRRLLTLIPRIACAA